MFFRVRMLRCGIETNANSDTVEVRHIRLILKTITKGMIDHEDFHSYFDDVY